MVAMNPQTWDNDVAGIEPGGYLVLRFDQADAEVEIPRRHHRHRRAAHRHLQSRIQRPAPAPIVQEHRLCRRAVGAARHGCRRNGEAHRRAVQGQGEAVRRQQARAASRPRLGDDECRAPDRLALEARRRGRRPHLHRRQFRRGAWARSMAAPRCAPGIRSRRRLRSPRRSPAIASACASMRKPKRTSSRSSRPRTSSPRSAW